ncbi:FKBP-type peptidyl-prolyl cis-trans isomerase [bacterium]|nr:FKBP-type peptidyl-prolyl cis-trans isomerase [bacterium]
MKLLTTLTVCGMFLLILNCKTSLNRGNSKLTTFEDSLSYLIGNDIAISHLLDVKDDLDLDAFIMGLKDQLDNQSLLITFEDREKITQKYEQILTMRDYDDDYDELAAYNLENGKQFLEKYRARKGVIITKSGLQYLVVKQGNGPKPAKNDKVILHYTGTTIDGTEFDSSYKLGETQTLAVNSFIKGFSEALQLMSVSSKFEIVLPPELAYGKQGRPPDIGPNAVLIFRIELLGIAQSL